jgi:hypothetical protein
MIMNYFFFLIIILKNTKILFRKCPINHFQDLNVKLANFYPFLILFLTAFKICLKNQDEIQRFYSFILYLIRKLFLSFDFN